LIERRFLLQDWSRRLIDYKFFLYQAGLYQKLVITLVEKLFMVRIEKCIKRKKTKFGLPVLYTLHEIGHTLSIRSQAPNPKCESNHFPGTI
jgi:hypothetical protein